MLFVANPFVLVDHHHHHQISYFQFHLQSFIIILCVPKSKPLCQFAAPASLLSQVRRVHRRELSHLVLVHFETSILFHRAISHYASQKKVSKRKRRAYSRQKTTSREWI